MGRDALWHPVGPLPPHVYWVRRAVLMAVGLAAILLVTSWLPGPGLDRSRRVANAPGPATSPVGSVSGSRSVRPSPSPSVARSPRPIETCPDDVLTVTATTDAGSYPPGVPPRLAIEVRNTGAVTCRRDIGPGARALTVRSGVDRIWSSDDCEGTAMSVVTLTPGSSGSYAVKWSRHRSGPGCASPGAPARPGTYRLYASLDRIAGSPVVFRLR